MSRLINEALSQELKASIILFRRLLDEQQLVNNHDFPNDATGIAISYGIYDPLANLGFAAIGASCEMPDFAVDVIELWWRQRLSLTCFKYRLAYQRCNL